MMVDFNHLYLVVDLPTYQAIRNSSYIQSLACTYEQRNNAEGQLGWEGFYIRGKNTFLEIFYPQARYPVPGISGIALGTQSVGHLQDVLRAFTSSYPSAQIGKFSKGGRSWFDYVCVDDSFFQEKHSFWIMEYSPDCFDENEQDISPLHYNSNRFDPTRSFLDVTEFSIALNPIGLEKLTSYLSICDLVRLEEFCFQTRAGIRIHLSEETLERKGIFQVRFSLSDGLSNSISLSMGGSKLEIENRQGEWHFQMNGSTTLQFN